MIDHPENAREVWRVGNNADTISGAEGEVGGNIKLLNLIQRFDDRAAENVDMPFGDGGVNIGKN